MQVLIIPSWYFKSGSLEIQGRMFHHHASALREKGIDARIFFAELNYYNSLKGVTSFANEDGIPTWRIAQWYLPKINYSITKAWASRYADIILNTVGDNIPDLIHAQSYLAGIVASEISRKAGIPFIITERLSAFATGHIRSHYKLLIRETFQLANMVTCVSPGLKIHLEKFTGAAINVIPNFFDPEIFYYDPTVEKRNPFSFVSIGEPARVKGLDSLIHAYCRMRKKFPAEPMQLIMIDDIKEKNELLKIAGRYGYADEIVWKGLMPQRDMAEILRKSHVLISASRIETFGKAILEAQACGLPAIATRTDGAQYIMHSKLQGILVGIDKLEELSAAMSHLFETYKNFDPSAIRDAVMKFSKGQVIPSWMAAYSDVLAK